MGFHIAVPDSIFGGWAKDFGRLRLGFLYHSLQSDQRWLFLIHWKRSPLKMDWRFGYRTRGESSSNEYSGWHWPWKYRFTSGRY